MHNLSVMLVVFLLALTSTAVSAQGKSSLPNEADIAAILFNRIKTAIVNEMKVVDAIKCELTDRRCLSQELLERYRIDQWVRNEFKTLMLCEDYATTHKTHCQNSFIGVMVFFVDLPNTRRLKEVVKVHDFPMSPKFDADVQLSAWFIAQHSQTIIDEGVASWDVDFVESILPDIKRVVELEHLTPWHYASMYDRILVARGYPQSYGTQYSCKNGRAIVAPIAEETGLSARRIELGMEKFDRHKYDEQCRHF